MSTSAGCGWARLYAVGGLAEVVHHGETGWLAAPDDVEGMADRIAALVADPGLRAKMGAAAREDAVRRFCADPMIALRSGVPPRRSGA